MTTKELEKNLSQLGFPLLEADAGQVDVNKTLADVAKSNNARYWEGFPVLLVNANKTGDFNVKEVEAFFSNETDRRKWRNLLVMSLAFYRAMNKVFWFAEQLRKTLSSKESDWFRKFWPRMRHDQNFELENKEFNVARLKTLFDNYMQEEALKAQKLKRSTTSFL